ncbi:hypothetical protein ACOMHN_036042 [Nucella lapillus]
MTNCVECVHSGLDLFNTTGLQTSIECGEWVEYRPLATLDEGPVEFLVRGGTEYLDLAHTFFQVKAKVVKPNGADLADADNAACGPVNLMLHSFRARCIFKLGASDLTLGELSIQGLPADSTELFAGHKGIPAGSFHVLQRHSGQI